MEGKICFGMLTTVAASLPGPFFLFFFSKVTLFVTLDVIKFVEAQPPLKDLRLHPWDLHPLSLFFLSPLDGCFVQWSLPGFHQLGDV
jgi:hypothetical protein